MIAAGWYFLKVIIVSGILYGYYMMALKDKVFHHWNRFYLLFIIAISLLLPFVSINIQSDAAQGGSVIKILQAFTTQDEIIIELGKSTIFSTENLIFTLYFFVCFAFFVRLLAGLLKIYKIKRKFPNTYVAGINFINTDVTGTPFSFFNSIFWNNVIDIHSPAGSHILNHEIAHVKEKHSYDKIFVNTVLLVFWLNPFFWLIRKDLNMIHEFIADKIALKDDDTSHFAEMILSSAYPNKQFILTNNFFYSPIKRRLKMLIKNKNSKVNYLSRLLILPLAALIFMAFAIKMKKASRPHSYYNGKPITVIIDAGHGGTDPGAIAEGLEEKNITLSLSKKIQELNTNKNIRIILSRDHDQTISVKDRVNFAIEKGADVFVSIHINAQEGGNTANGLGVTIPKNDNDYLNSSKLLGSSIIQSFKENFPLRISNQLYQMNNNTWILKANKFPAALVQAGFITSKVDMEYLSKPENQKIFAQNILNGIENYAQNKNAQVSEMITDTIPKMYYKNKKVTGISVRPAQNNIKVTYEDGSTEIISKKEAEKRGFILPPPPPPTPPTTLPPPPPPPPPPAPLEPVSNSSDTQPRMQNIFTKVDKEAQFPGGPSAWSQYISEKISASIKIFDDSDFGTCTVEFVVDKNGNVSNVKPITMAGSHLAEIAVSAIKLGPKWIPAMQNNHAVNSYRRQPVTLTKP